MNKIISYKNGGCGVVIKPDGSKTRYIIDENSLPILPESIDLKITNKCTMPDGIENCKYCHESSTPKGKHAKSEFIFWLISQMQPGSELAIGGGNPLEHPDLEKILIYAKAKGVIVNLTVNQFHTDNYKIDYYMNRQYINGLGISYQNSYKFSKTFYRLYCKYLQRIVFHYILGVHDIDDLKHLLIDFRYCKVLILGYKVYGFGSKFLSKNDLLRSIEEYNKFSFLKHHISFDNLAIEQLDIRSRYTDLFKDRYMGDDGEYTMYVDATTKRYGKSSTDLRYCIKNQNLEQIFRNIREYRIIPKL